MKDRLTTEEFNKEKIASNLTLEELTSREIKLEIPKLNNKLQSSMSNGSN